MDLTHADIPTHSILLYTVILFYCRGRSRKDKGGGGEQALKEKEKEAVEEEVEEEERYQSIECGGLRVIGGWAAVGGHRWSGFDVEGRWLLRNCEHYRAKPIDPVPY
ncbi:hypothetical protein BHE74_00046521 [Ensete ventricosum]|nr:hypothetical protein BHE74_00046521 [Ensete ventricosum]RZS01416.1 hypothetical protein BHM03_00031263 [Ensete ventricosum]